LELYHDHCQPIKVSDYSKKNFKKKRGKAPFYSAIID